MITVIGASTLRDDSRLSRVRAGSVRPNCRLVCGVICGVCARERSSRARRFGGGGLRVPSALWGELGCPLGSRSRRCRRSSRDHGRGRSPFAVSARDWSLPPRLSSVSCSPGDTGRPFVRPRHGGVPFCSGSWLAVYATLPETHAEHEEEPTSATGWTGV